MAVFVLHERLVGNGKALEAVCDLLKHKGFDVLAARHLTDDERARLTAWQRGRGRIGPEPASAIIAAIDTYPFPPTRHLLSSQPLADNERAHRAERLIARTMSKKAAPTRGPVVVASDNSAEAAQCIAVVLPDALQAIKAEAERALARAGADGHVVRRLTRRGRSAVVELIEHANGVLAVRKRFRPGYEAHFAREMAALQALRPICPDVVPPILAHGRNFVVIPYYEDARSPLRRMLRLPLPVRAVRKAFAAAQAFLDCGYLHTDFRPHNVIVQGGGEIKIIDYESIWDCRAQTPHGAAFHPFDPTLYRLYWSRAASLPLHSALHDPLWLAVLKRWTIGPFIFARATVSKLLGTSRERKPAASAHLAGTPRLPSVEHKAAAE